MNWEFSEMVYPIATPRNFETTHVQIILSNGLSVVFNLGTTGLIGPEKLWTEFECAKNYNKAKEVVVYTRKESLGNPIILHEWVNPNTP